MENKGIKLKKKNGEGAQNKLQHHRRPEILRADPK